MALFKNMYITSKGMELYAKAQAGQEIHFTKMQVGSGQIETQNPVTLLALLDPKLDVPITSIVPNPEFKSATIIGSITNRDVKEALYICELGLFAKDPDEGEILYGYVSAGQYGDYYAPEAQGPYSWQYEVNAAIGNAANVTAELSELQWDYGVINSNKYFLHLKGGNQREINKSIDELFDTVIKDAEDFKTNIRKGIGTKNLIFNSNFKNGLNLWSSWNNSTLNVDENLNCIVKAVINEQQGFGILTPTVSLVKGQKYTVSFLLSSYYNVDILDYLYIISASAGNTKLSDLKIDKSTTLYNYYNFTFTAPYSTNDAKILIGAVKKGVEYEGFRLRNVKVEKGIIPSDWTPAPEEITNKLDTIQTGAEVNQNAISKIKIREQILIPTSKTDTIELKLDSNIKTSITNKEITIKRRVKLGEPLELNINPQMGKDDNIETTPFKTIQAVIDYVKNYYVYLEKGAIINITPGTYTERINISNVNNNFNNIELKSTNINNIPLAGNTGNIEDYVILNNLTVNNTSAPIQFSGVFLSGNNYDNIIKETAEDGKPLGKLADATSNFNIIFYKSRLYGAESNAQNLGYFYGVRTLYTNIVFQDSFLDKFDFKVSGGNAGPVRIGSNSNVTITNCKFGNNTSYDIVGDEAVIKVRKSNRIDGQPLKTNLSGSCFFLQGN